VLIGTGVALGAFGAHLLKARFEASGQAATWETAVRYQLVHGVALLAWSAGSAAWPVSFRAQRWVGRGLVLGALLFSGSLYGLALDGPRWLGPITPLGGTIWLATWLSVAWLARPGRRNAP
jgi:uncharacterized membrane protein YgdD (TMEM256/DUF423 family)